MDTNTLLILVFFGGTGAYLYSSWAARRRELAAERTSAVRTARTQVSRAGENLAAAPFVLAGAPLEAIRAGMSSVETAALGTPAAAAAAADRVRTAAEFISMQLVVAGGRFRGDLVDPGADEPTHRVAMARLRAGDGTFADVAALTDDLVPPSRRDLTSTWDDGGAGSALFFIDSDTIAPPPTEYPELDDAPVV